MHHRHGGQQRFAVLAHKFERLGSDGHDDADVTFRIFAVQKLGMQFFVVIANRPLRVEKLAVELDRATDSCGNCLAQRVINEDARRQRSLIAVDDQHAFDKRLCYRSGRST